MPTVPAVYGAGRRTVITGAAHGLGAALAAEIAGHGGSLALADLDESELERSAERCRVAGAGDVITAVVDVRDPEAVTRFAHDVLDRAGDVQAVINNAGVLFTGDVAATTVEELAGVFDVNFWGVVHGTKTFLPLLRDQPHSRIVNISSAFGLITAPGYSAYSASKFAVRGFTAALQQELLTTPAVSLRACCVHPGGLKTAIARRSTAAHGVDLAGVADRFDRHVARTNAQHAARAILRGSAAGKGSIHVGLDAHLGAALARLLGGRYVDLIRLAQIVSDRHTRHAPDPTPETPSI